jgi:hypothetical protein
LKAYAEKTSQYVRAMYLIRNPNYHLLLLQCAFFTKANHTWVTLPETEQLWNDLVTRVTTATTGDTCELYDLETKLMENISSKTLIGITTFDEENSSPIQKKTKDILTTSFKHKVVIPIRVLLEIFSISLVSKS